MKRFVRSPYLEIEHRQDDEIIVVHLRLGSRLKINAATYQFLDLFREAHSLEELSHFGPIEKARPSFELLRKVGFLVEEGHAETISDKILQRINPGFFGCPSVGVGGREGCDVLFVGVPFDYGNLKEPGARFGPMALRQVSVADSRFYGLDSETERPRGWYDNAIDRHILEGVRMADAGNLFIAPNEDPQRVFHKLGEVVSDFLKTDSLPVVIGGDHSVTYPIVAAYSEPIAIIHIDAHTDLASYYPSVANHHGNVMSRALALEHVVAVYQIGIRGTTSIPQTRGGGRVALAISPHKLREVGIEGLLELIPADLDHYVSLDIDALDPIYAPGTSTPVPGGLSFEEVKMLLMALASRRRCVGFDLVEVNPRRDVNELTAVVGVELLLSFLGAHFQGTGGEIE